jgi:cytoskeletal protein CcmA (bactofilin family)
MWKAIQSVNHAPVPAPVSFPEPVAPTPAAPVLEVSSHPQPITTIHDSALIYKDQVFKGEITGGGSLFVDGRVEGGINLPNERVTIGQHGVVVGSFSAANACIVAREIVIMGTVTGNVSASDRVEIRAEGTLNGEVSTARISIADGAYFRGGVDIRKKPVRMVSAIAEYDDDAVKTA